MVTATAECLCGSTDLRLVNSEDGVDVYRCRDCGTYTENDTFVPHARRNVRKMRRGDDD